MRILIWPWSKIAALEKQLQKTETQLNACQLIAVGAFHLNMSVQEQASGAYNPDVWCPAVAEVIKLVRLLDEYTEPPPYRYRNIPHFEKRTTKKRGKAK